MRSIAPCFFSAILLSTLIAASNVSIPDVKRVTAGSSNVMPNRYIVEFDSASTMQAAGLSRRAATAHESVYIQLEDRGVSFVVNQEYSSEVFTGASISITSQSELGSLASIQGLVNMYPVRMMVLLDAAHVDNTWGSGGGKSASAPPSSSASATSSAGVSTTTTCSGHGKKQKCSTTTVTATRSATATPSSTGFSILPQIGADKVQATGNKGKGVQIGIVDTGVDYTRTPLGGCFGPGCKIAGGYDFVGDNYNGTNSPEPDNDPFDGCYGHGTFVSGIIGANDNEYGVTGVAPEATLYMYRVYSCDGSSTDDIIAQAIIRAYTDGADVINLSLGEYSGWTESPLSVIASRVTSKGVVVSASGGNEGQVGAFYANSPSDGYGVISVGSVDNAIFAAQNATVSTGYGPLRYFDFATFAPGTYPLYAFSTDPSVTNDACSALPAVANLADYLVLVRRGGCALEDKAMNVYHAGGRHMFLVDYTDGAAPTYEPTFPLDFAFVSYSDGTYLINQFASGKNTTLDFFFNPAPVPNNITGGSVSYFSSIGPTDDMYIGVSVLAPGSHIVGVLPTALRNWTIDDGTSYSGAYGSGAAALYINAMGKTVAPKIVREAFEATANPVPVSPSNSQLESVAAQGAGKLAIYDTINSPVTVSPTELLLNDTAYFNGSQSITITNKGRSTAQYKISNLPAGTALAFMTGLNQSNDEPVPQVSSTASVWISKTSITVPAGHSVSVTLEFTAPSGLDSQTFPIYSGFIQISGGGTTVQVPYLGLAAALKDMPILDPSTYYLGSPAPDIMNATGVQSGSESYTFQGEDYPTVLYRQVGGTPLLLIDLVSANASLGFTPNYTTRKRSLTSGEMAQKERANFAARRIGGTSGSQSPPGKNLGWLSGLICRLTNNRAQGCKDRGSTPNTFQSVPILGNLYEQQYLPRNTDNADGDGNDYSTFALPSPVFTNGTTIPDGSYRFLLRALHITGDATKESDYEAWLSMPFVVTA